jgi:hypothetical protein
MDETSEKKSLSKAEVKALFEAYEKASSECDVAEKALEDLKAKKALTVQAISEGTGSHGPFSWKGQELTISKRGDSWYFRGKTQRGLRAILAQLEAALKVD